MGWRSTQTSFSCSQRLPQRSKAASLTGFNNHDVQVTTLQQWEAADPSSLPSATLPHHTRHTMPARNLAPRPQLNLFIGEQVRAHRTRLGLTQDQLGQKSGLHRVAIGYLERGATTPSVLTLSVVAEALEIPVSELLDGYELDRTQVEPSWTSRRRVAQAT